MCQTNHSLSYARSPDLVHWETSSGRPLTLPITPLTGEVVDPVPVRSGMINGNTSIGFDAEGRVILTYHKFDAAGHTQVFNARREEDHWRIVHASRWTFRWPFEGPGSMIFDVRLGPVWPGADGMLHQSSWNRHDGNGGVRLDPVTLTPIGPYVPPTIYPVTLSAPEQPGMEVHWRVEGASPLTVEADPDAVPHRRFVLRWETLPANRDRPRLATRLPPHG